MKIRINTKKNDMSKATVKKILMSMQKEELIGMVLEMYDARKEAKEYLEFFVNPDEDGKLNEYKKIIEEEFYPSQLLHSHL